MANYSNLKAAIAAAIKQNGNQEITGQVLQDVLTSMVSVIGANYTFAGVATPATNPGTPDQNVVYLASKGGTYTNFGGIELPAGISLLMWNGAWTAQTFFVLDDVPTVGSNNLVKSGGIYSSTPNIKGFPITREVSDYNNIINGAEAETVRGKIYDPYTEVFGFDKILYRYTVTDGQIVQSPADFSLACIAVKKGNVVRIFSSQSGTGNASAVVPYFSVDYPSEGVNVTPITGQKTIVDGTTINFLLEAPQNGYFVIRHYIRNTITFHGFKKANHTTLATRNYIRQELHVPIKIAYGIDTDKSSETFGQMISIVSNTYGCSDYIEVSPNDTLFTILRITTAIGFKNKQIGICFYDSGKNVIDGITTCYYDLLASSLYSFIDIPANAKYARFSGYGAVDEHNNRPVINGIFICKRKGNYDLSLYNDMTKSLLKQAEYTVSPLTIIPSITDTYNAYYRKTSTDNMKADFDYMYRLTYFPNYLVGGGEITIRYDGKGLMLYELPYIPLDTSPVEAFNTSEIIRAISLPFTDSMTEYTLTLSKECKRIAIVWGYVDGTTQLNPNDVLNYISEITLPVIVPSSINIDVDPDVAYPYQYIGETIKFNRTYKNTLFASNSISGQSAAIYGDYLFIPKAKLTSISLYKMKEKRIVYTFNTGYTKDAIWHCNQCQFGIDKYDETDMFPLLWITVNNDTNGRCAWVGFRIIPAFDEDNNIVSFSITEIQTIHLPVMTDENCLGNFNIAVDYDNKCFWGYGRNNNSEASNYQKAHFAKFPIPALFDNGVLVSEVTYNDEDILEQFSDNWSMTYAQGGFIKDGRLYIMQGGPNVNLIYLRVIDLYIAKKQVSYVDLFANGFRQEPEGVFFYEGRLFTATLNSNIHRFDFS